MISVNKEKITLINEEIDIAKTSFEVKLLAAMGIPIAFGLGLASFLAIIVSDKTPVMVFAQRMIIASDSFLLMAIIFFVIAGGLMLQGVFQSD